MKKQEKRQLSLQEYPQPAVSTDGELVLEVNEKAAVLFPELKAGEPLPAVLTPPEDASEWEGTAVLAGRGCSVRGERLADRVIYTILPREQQALSEGQLDGVLYRMRTLVAELYRNLLPCVGDEEEPLSLESKNALSAGVYRMLRMLDHLDLLRDAAGNELQCGGEESELCSLCRTVAMEAGSILETVGIRLEYEIRANACYLHGDEGYLRDALLELISNCARRLPDGGTIRMTLSGKQNRATICITDSGSPAQARERAAITARGSAPRIPLPGEGAGLGLAVAEQLVRLHGGAVFFSVDDRAPRAYISLPVHGRPEGKISLRTSRPGRNEGMSPYLIALSDVLPGNVVREDWKL